MFELLSKKIGLTAFDIYCTHLRVKWKVLVIHWANGGHSVPVSWCIIVISYYVYPQYTDLMGFNDILPSGHHYRALVVHSYKYIRNSNVMSRG